MAVTNRTNEPVASGDPTVVDSRAQDPALAEERGVAPRRGWRRRRATTAVAAAGAGTSLLLARIVRAITTIVGLILALGILFVLLKASPSNTIVSHVHDWAHWLATPFNGLFHLHSARATIALNWAIALVVYMVIGHLIARLLASPHRAWRRREAAA